MKKAQDTYIVAVCGASGIIYSLRVLKALLSLPVTVLLVVSNAGYRVMAHETGLAPSGPINDFLGENGVVFHGEANLEVLDAADISGAPASGSFVHSGMAVVPCSMNTLSNIAAGHAHNLITRAADVSLKEGRTLILVPRETPLNLIHLENMTRAARAGAVIMPAAPSFYAMPRTIADLADTIAARILDRFGIANDLVERWHGKTG